MVRSTIQHSPSFYCLQTNEPEEKLDLSQVFSKLEMQPELEEASFAMSDSDSSVASSGQREPSVRFSIVQVREYSLTIGDHPCCRSGCPLSLDWDYETKTSVKIDQFEAERAPQRRSRHELITTWDERKAMLQDVHSDIELNRCARKLQRARSSSRYQKQAVQGFFCSNNNA